MCPIRTHEAGACHFRTAAETNLIVKSPGNDKTSLEKNTNVQRMLIVRRVVFHRGLEGQPGNGPCGICQARFGDENSSGGIGAVTASCVAFCSQLADKPRIANCAWWETSSKVSLNNKI